MQARICRGATGGEHLLIRALASCVVRRGARQAERRPIAVCRGAGFARDGPQDFKRQRRSCLIRGVQPQFLDFARGGVASYAQTLRGFHAAAVGGVQRGADQAGLEAPREHIPQLRLAAGEQLLCLDFQFFFPTGPMAVVLPLGAGGGKGRHCRCVARHSGGHKRGGGFPPGRGGGGGGGGASGGGAGGGQVAVAGPPPGSLAWPICPPRGGGGCAAWCAGASSTSGGRSCSEITWAGAMTVSQWQMFSNWRTLPG